MPGHIYAQLGRWEEAARAMEAAARVERRYFREHGMLPFHSWNYAHDLDYLVAILGYLGRAGEGTRLACELTAMPHDPEHNSKEGGAQRTGRFALMRMLVRFERWDAILGDGSPDWSDLPVERGWRAYCLGLAHLGKGNREAARQQLEALEAVHAELVKAKDDWEGHRMETAGHELGGLLLIAEGKSLEGFERLNKAAELERRHLTGNDPGPYPRPILETLGRAHLEAKNWGLAEAVFEEALKRTPNSGPALAGLAEACLALEKRDAGAKAYEKLAAVWKYADPDLPAVRRVQALGLGPRLAARGGAATIGGARWESGDLEALGPNAWEPAPAPGVALRDAAGKTHTLADYRGKNVVLVFYLGGDCSHCVEQLNGLGKEMPALKQRNTTVLAISAAPAAKGKAPRAPFPFPVLFDTEERAAAKKYQAHDTFESRDLHATIFIDPEGRVRWYRVASSPFTDWAFLKSEIDRVTRLRAAGAGRTEVRVAR
jgi:peroxiredoxin/tetratricopeptide (TPR) repeat protein